MIEIKINSGGYYRKTAKIVVSTLIILISLSLTASACHIGDWVWEDLNANGIQETGEPGIPGVTVNLYQNDGAYLENTTTDSTGHYNFSLSSNRNYYVEFVLPTGFVFSPQDQGNDDTKDSDANTITGKTIFTYMSSYEYDRTWDAGMYEEPEPETASVGNFVWNDLNLNGEQDDGENGMSNITVGLYTCEGEWVANTTTNSTGFYEFTYLNPGSYYLVFTNPSKYSFSEPEQGTDDAKDSDAGTNGNTKCFSLAPGEYNEVIDAGLYNKEEVPEFPTVALPMIAIIGIAFIFGRRDE